MFSSNLLMNRFAYVGATRVPIAVPLTCGQFSPLNWKLLLVSTISNNPNRLWFVGFSVLSVLSLTYDSLSFTRGLRKWSTNAEIFSVGQLLADTIGLPGGGHV